MNHPLLNFHGKLRSRSSGHKNWLSIGAYFVAALLLLTATWDSHALSYGTPNGSAARVIASRMDECRVDGEKIPETWEEIDAVYGESMAEKFDYVKPTQRYAFIKEKVSLPQGRVLLIMRSPFRNVRKYWTWYGGIANGLTERGRYAIYQDATTSQIRSSFIPEKEVLRAFAESGVSLPVPDDLGPFPHEAEIRAGQIVKIVLTCFAVLLAFFLYRCLRIYRIEQAERARVKALGHEKRNGLQSI